MQYDLTINRLKEKYPYLAFYETGEYFSWSGTIQFYGENINGCFQFGNVLIRPSKKDIEDDIKKTIRHFKKYIPCKEWKFVDRYEI